MLAECILTRKLQVSICMFCSCSSNLLLSLCYHICAEHWSEAAILSSESIMEQVIYVTFVMLCIMAYGTRQLANAGEEKRGSISNTSFKRFALWAVDDQDI